MSCCESQSQADECLGRTTRFFGWLLLLAVGGFILASLPEVKRYIKISSM
jgi:hypothetical protein